MTLAELKNELAELRRQERRIEAIIAQLEKKETEYESKKDDDE